MWGFEGLRIATSSPDRRLSISMDLFSRVESVGSTDGGDSSASDSTFLRMTDLLLKRTSFERPAVLVSRESRYLTQLWVFGDRGPWEEQNSDSCLSRITRFKPKAENSVPQFEVKEKIRAALKLLSFREKHVLVQFWSPHVLGKHRLLTTLDQPFGVGAVDEGLFFYRRDSECNPFLVDKDHEEDDSGPPARVYRRGLPEWTSDITNYTPKDFPLQECAIRCNLFGYLALPVFDSTTRLCVGVLELLMSSKNMGYAYEVKQIHKALKTTNLATPQVFGCPTSEVHCESKQNRRDKILGILKIVCDTHGLPLGQTWAVSPFSSYVAHEKVLEKSCSSFNTECIGKVCMSTSTLPFYVRDLSMWSFREACREQHLEKSRGFIGKALLSNGSCFCSDVSELSEEEYPFVHNARKSGLTSCFTIFLHSVEGIDEDYVLEFFLPMDIQESRYLLDLVQTIKQNIQVTSGFELGDTSSIQVFGPPRGINNLCFDPPTIQISSNTTANTPDSSDSEAYTSTYWTDSSDSETNSQTFETDSSDSEANSSTSETDSLDLVSFAANVAKTNDTFSDARINNRKRKADSLTLEPAEQHLGQPIVSQEQNTSSSWPVTKHMKETDYFTDLNLSKRPRSENVGLRMFCVVLLVVKLKRWSCSSKHYGLSGKWWICGRHRRLFKSRLDIRQVVRLMVMLRRWRKRSTRHVYGYTDYPYLNNDWQFPYFDFVHAYPNQALSVKATFKENMIKFPFVISSGLLELEKEVAQRIKVHGGKFLLKYRDEDDDLILIACDADLQNLLGFLARKTTLRLVVDLADV